MGWEFAAGPREAAGLVAAAFIEREGHAALSRPLQPAAGKERA